MYLIVGRFILIAAVVFQCISCQVQQSTTEGEEIIHGKVKELGSGASGRGDNLPSSLWVDLALARGDVHLNFSKNTDINCHLPVYSLSTDKNGKVQFHRERFSQEKSFGLYQDLKNGAAFGVTREVDGHRAPHLNVEGILQTAGKTLSVKSAGGRTTSQDHPRNYSDDVLLGGQEEDFVLSQQAVLSANDTAGSNPSRTSRQLPRFRTPRTVTQDVFIDIVALADYSVYQHWLGQSAGGTTAARKQDALQNIRRFFAFTFNGVNLLYKSITGLSYTIHVKLTSLVVATNQSSSAWTESRSHARRGGPGRKQVDAGEVLQAVSKWARDNNRRLPAHDHVMLFTEYDIYSTKADGSSNDGVAGLANLGRLCYTSSGLSASISESFQGLALCTFTAAHELGHSLSALHDGQDNTCDGSHHYIMAAVGGSISNPVYRYNVWSFSTCSVNYFRTFISRTAALTLGRDCLFQSETADSDLPDVTSQMPGQQYDVNEQCRNMKGTDSSICVSLITNNSELCQAVGGTGGMPCFSSADGKCYRALPARGTSCGNKKWCIRGRCVFNNAAPTKDESCLFGDAEGAFIQRYLARVEQSDCPSFINSLNANCYHEQTRKHCCRSCARVYRLVRGCEYGDKLKGCSAAHCAVPANVPNCCETCNYGTPFTTTTTTTTTITIRIATTATTITITARTPETPDAAHTKTSKSGGQSSASENNTSQTGENAQTRKAKNGEDKSQSSTAAVAGGVGAAVVLAMAAAAAVYYKRFRQARTPREEGHRGTRHRPATRDSKPGPKREQNASELDTDQSDDSDTSSASGQSGDSKEAEEDS